MPICLEAVLLPWLWKSLVWLGTLALRICFLRCILLFPWPQVHPKVLKDSWLWVLICWNLKVCLLYSSSGWRCYFPKEYQELPVPLNPEQCPHVRLRLWQTKARKAISAVSCFNLLWGKGWQKSAHLLQLEAGEKNMGRKNVNCLKCPDFQRLCYILVCFCWMFCLFR